MKTFIYKYFHLKELNTSIKYEFYAALATFLSMSYIIFVNPNILALSGMPKGALITATIISVIIGTGLSGLVAKLPIAIAPGMGLNAFFTYNLVIANKIPWQEALFIVFISGAIFFVLSILGFQNKIVKHLPISIKAGVFCGLGLFITFIGFINMGVIGHNASTFVQLNSLSASSVIALIGLAIVIILAIYDVKGYLVIGIIISTLIALVTGIVSPPSHLITLPPSLAPIAFHIQIPHAFTLSIISSIFSLMFVDLFDSVSTVATVTDKINFKNEEQKLKASNKALKVDAFTSAMGGVIGTSTTTTYMESIVGILQGGKSGLTAVFIAILFIFTLFISPIVALVPAFAVAPAMIVVGILMIRGFQLIDLSDFKQAVPAYLTAFLMPFTYNIGFGLIFGFLSHILIQIATGKIKEIHWIIWVIGLLCIIELILI
jgi:AGZA family xanthine/uracil permease-like MFS transporter